VERYIVADGTDQDSTWLKFPGEMFSSISGKTTGTTMQKVMLHLQGEWNGSWNRWEY